MSRAAGLAAAGAALVVVGLLFDVVALLLPGLAAAGLGLGAIAWTSAAAGGASLRRELPSDRVTEGELWPVRITVRASGMRAARIELVDPLLSGPPRRLRGRAPRARLEVRFERRGRRLLEPARVAITDPLRLAVREVVGEPGEVLVVPRVEPVELRAGSGSSGAGAEPRAGRLEAVGAALELDSLRPYRRGTPAARIHWPTVARTGEMVERRLTAGVDERPLVVLDARRPSGVEALDRAVRAAASLVRHLGGRSGCGLLLPGERRPLELASDLVAWPSLHARLAAVEESPRAPALERAHRAAAVYWVTAGPGRPPRELRSAGGARYLVEPADGDAPDVAFTVAGCAGRPIASTRARAA